MKLDARTDAYLAALADELKRLREEAGLSKNRLAERAGLSQQMVSYVERRLKNPTAGTVYRLAVALGTTPGAIFAEADRMSMRSPCPSPQVPAAKRSDT